MGERSIGLPPAKDAPAPDVDPHAMRTARLVNLFGLFTPAANLGLLWVGPRDRRWWGLGAGLFCAALIGYASWRDRPWLMWTGASIHYALVVVGLVHPLAVAKVADAWAGFGTLLGKAMAYPIFTVVYFLVVTPTSLLVRVLGKDPLGAKKTDADTYWTVHEPPPRESYERQF